MSDWASDPPAVIRDKIVGVNAHAIVLKLTGHFAEYRDVLAIVERTPDVIAAEPFLFDEVEITSAGHAPVHLSIKGVDPTRVTRVLALATHLQSGSIDSLASGSPPSIILGDVLAKNLGVRIGDPVTLTPTANPYRQVAGAPKQFRVSGTFHVAFDAYDGGLAYASVPAVQDLLGVGDEVLGVELAVTDLDRSATVVKAIDHALALEGAYKVMDWYELNEQLFRSLLGDRKP